MNSHDGVFTLVMPISGAKTANVIAIMLRLVKNKYMPNLILGTSGGCITGLMMLVCGVADVKDDESYQLFRKKIDYITSNLDANCYRQSNCPLVAINTVISLNTGGLFKRGKLYGKHELESVDIKGQPELIMGTTKKNPKRSKLFSTKNKCDSIVNMDDVEYLNENMKDIIDVCTASSAVPGLVEAIKFKSGLYSDGGLTYASPLGPCLHLFNMKIGECNTVCNNKHGNYMFYRIVYVSPYKYDSNEDPTTDEIEDDDVWRLISSASMGMATGLHIPDRNNGIRAVGKNAKKETGVGGKFLRKCLAIQKRSIRSFIELAPLNVVHCNFLTMEKGEMKDCVDKSYTCGFSVTHWYV